MKFIGVTTVKLEDLQRDDGGWGKSFTVDLLEVEVPGDLSIQSGEDGDLRAPSQYRAVGVTVGSYHISKSPRHPEIEEYVGKRVRVTVEVLEDE